MRRVSAFLRRHFLTMLGALVLLALVVILWLFSTPIAPWVHSALSFDAVAFLGEHLLAIGMLGGFLVVLALIWLPKWQAARPELTPQARVEAENEARKTLAQIIGGAAVLAGLYFTWGTLEVSREGQVTERFTKAIDQLGAVNDTGEKQLEIRLGGIYALDRIARDSKKDHWPIMEVLTAYVRENAPWPAKPPKDTPPQQDQPSLKGDPATTQGQPTPKLATDIQAVLTVLGGRKQTYGKGEEKRLNLAKTDLRGADLRRAQLQGADLGGAQLQRADLGRTELQEAKLEEAQLQGAYFEGAQLQGASLRGAQLKGAKNLTVEQLAAVKTLYGADLDPPLLEQIQQQYPQLLEKP